MSNVKIIMQAEKTGLSETFLNLEPKHRVYTNKSSLALSSGGGTINVVEIHDVNGDVTDRTDSIDGFLENCVLIMDTVIQKSVDNTLSTNTSLLVAELSNQFPGLTFEVESILSDGKNNLFPTKIMVTDPRDSISGTVFFSKYTFESDYNGSHVEVIPLLDNLDKFGYIGKEELIDAIGNLETMPFQDAIKAITTDHPCTYVDVVKYKWVNLDNSPEAVYVPFGLVCYGHPTEEDIANAVRDHIMDNSSLSRPRLAEIFPLLFGEYGYTLFPYWNDLAEDNVSDIYSPVNDIRAMLGYIKTKINVFTDAHVDSEWETIPTSYQSLAMICIKDEITNPELGKFDDVISGYHLTAPLDPEFVTFPESTRHFIKKLFDALAMAESYPDTVVSEGLDTELLPSGLYITFYSNGLRWRVLSRDSYMKNL